MPAYSLRCPIVGRGCARTDLATMAFVSKKAMPKLPNKPLKRDYPTFFSSLSSHSLMPTSCSISAS
jgi:hypothetical protein